MCPWPPPRRLANSSSADRHVMISVSDTRAGMDDTRAHTCSSRFLIKPSGQGTGLGLATVYGIVKQSGGSISVSSELG
jgi:two-component system cell cycle sensor histidine kinase/response regulator CckA